MRLIDADEVILSYRELIRSPYLRENSARRDGADYIIEFCVKSNFGKENTIKPVKHGRWIINTDDFTPAYRCTCCGYNKPMIAGERANNDPGRYCQNCGAKMEGVDG